MKFLSNKVSIFLLITLILSVSYNSSAELSDKGYKELHNLTTVIHYVEDNYVEVPDEQKMVIGAIKGLLSTLDPHSVYLSPEVYKELQLDTAGRFQGVGIEVGFRDDNLTIISPIKGSPAEKAGIKSGDVIVAIDSKQVNQIDMSEVVGMIRGKIGTKVTLTVQRKDVKKPIDFKLTRTVIRVQSVEHAVLDKDYGYIAISSFQNDTTSSLEKAIKQLKNKDAFKGLILDLRQNPGGLLDQAVSVSEIFLDKGLIVTTESRGKEIERHEAHKDSDDVDVPLIILVDEGTASAAEIVAGALKDNGRAVILGQQTFGKGSVQTVIKLDDGGALKLTVAKYYTPSHVSIQANGIKPDIIVPKEAPKDTKDSKENSFREKDLSGHLAPETELTNVEKSKIDDYQKKVALDYLKSWSIFKQTGPNDKIENGGN